jgi:hypothetical protein
MNREAERSAEHHGVPELNQSKGKKFDLKKMKKLLDKVKLCAICNDNKFISKWLDATTVHGIVHVFKGKSLIRKLIWAVIFLAAASVCLYNVTERIRFFASDPTSTAISVTVQNIIPFPAVTLCNLNLINREFSEHTNLTNLLNLIYNPLFLYLTNPQFYYQEVNETCNQLLNDVPDYARNLNLSQLYSTDFATLEYSPLIRSCIFSDRDCTNDFIPVVTTLGLCYSFNTNGTIFYSNGIGTRSGLTMLLDINQMYNYAASYGGIAGVKIAIHERGTIPEPDETGIAVGPGNHAYIGLRARSTVDKTERGCVPASSSKPKFFENFNHSVSSCRIDTYLNALARECGCLFPYTTASDPDLRECTVDDLCCFFKVVNINLTDEVTACRPSCNRSTFQTFTSYANFPSLNTARELSEVLNIPTNAILSDLISLNIYFEDLGETEIITTAPYNFISLLSDIGGQLGLFVGASVISMLEIGMLLFDLFKDLTFVRLYKEYHKQKKKEYEFSNSVVKVNNNDGNVELTKF